MDYTKDKNVFSEEKDQQSKEGMNRAFGKQSGISYLNNVALPKGPGSKKLIPMSMRLSKETKDGISELAKRQGYRSTNSFLEALLSEIVENANRQ